MCWNLRAETETGLSSTEINELKSAFTKPLGKWYDQNKRDLPWRRTDDPYLIWVSEIMLQQTRVDQATPYYLRFIERFPDVKSLAEADRQDVLRLWEGLGYYSRARNLQDAARQIMEQLDGVFPDNYDEIRSLKGIGPYTAAAVGSIAFGLNYPVVDGNVIRVLSRWFGITEDVDKSAVKKEIESHAGLLLDEENPGDFNQALMEIGATVCSPRNPDCENCPVNDGCMAYKTAQTETIPYKALKKKVPHHIIAVGICVDEKSGKVLIAKRPEDKMLGGLWEFPGGKAKTGETPEDTLHRELDEELGVKISILGKLMSLNHAYSHFKITMHAYMCVITDGKPEPKASRELKWVSRDELENYPFPKANRRLTEKLVSGENIPLTKTLFDNS